MRRSKKIILLLSALFIGNLSCESPTEPEPLVNLQGLAGTVWTGNAMPKQKILTYLDSSIDPLEPFELDLAFTDDKSGSYIMKAVRISLP